MRNPFLIVLMILLVPMAQFLIPVMVGIAVIAAIYTLLRDAFDGVSQAIHHAPAH